MVRDESSARLKRIVLALELMTQVSLPAPSTAQVRVTSSPAQAENNHATSEVVGRHLDAAIGALMYLSSILSVLKKYLKNNKKATQSGISEMCHKRLTWLVETTRGCVVA